MKNQLKYLKIICHPKFFLNYLPFRYSDMDCKARVANLYLPLVGITFIFNLVFSGFAKNDIIILMIPSFILHL